jgi:hypothetical protein
MVAASVLDQCALCAWQAPERPLIPVLGIQGCLLSSTTASAKGPLALPGSAKTSRDTHSCTTALLALLARSSELSCGISWTQPPLHHCCMQPAPQSAAWPLSNAPDM